MFRTKGACMHSTQNETSGNMKRNRSESGYDEKIADCAA